MTEAKVEMRYGATWGEVYPGKAKRLSCSPLSLLEKLVLFRSWREHLGAHLLNAEAKVYRLADVPQHSEPFFIRPCLDDKSFSGMVTTWEEFARWRESVLDLEEYTTVTAETVVAVSEPKTLQREYRMVIVDGRVVTGTRYKLGDRVISSPEVEPEVHAFAQEMADR